MRSRAKDFLSVPIGFELIEYGDKIYLYYGTEFVASFPCHIDFELVQVFLRKWKENYGEP